VNVTGSGPVTQDLTVNVATSVAPGTYNLQLRATSGSLTKTAGLSLTVMASGGGGGGAPPGPYAPRGRGTWLYGVAYGNGTFVAVGERRHHPHLPGRGDLDAADLGDERLLFLNGVTYGNGLFVAVGDYGAPSSPPRTG
jgi:hypothetical protein